MPLALASAPWVRTPDEEPVTNLVFKLEKFETKSRGRDDRTVVRWTRLGGRGSGSPWSSVERAFHDEGQE